MIWNLRFTSWKLATLALLSCFTHLPPAANAGPAVTSIAGGAFHSLFTKSDGSLWGMGYNGDGELGIGFAPTMTNIPVQILASGAGTVAAGPEAFHSFFRMGRDLWAMGYNQFGQLGDGTTNNNHYFPEKIFSGTTGLGGISASVAAAGSAHSLFATSSSVVGNNTLRAMGDNEIGQLGDGTYNQRNTPEQIGSGIILAVSAGYAFSLFARSDGSLWGMGRNDSGQLGIGTTSYTNIQVKSVSSGVTAIAAGGFHSLFIKSDGSLWGMGYNGDGQLGDNSTAEEHTPEQLAFNGVTAVAAGCDHSVYLRSDGSLWGMGYNAYGQLGDGTTNNHLFAFQIVASNVVAVAAGCYHTLFIKTDGSLWGMGNNGEGELGDGSNTNHLTPFEILAGVPPAPIITGLTLSRTNVILTGANGVSGEILYTLMTTNVTQPLNQWKPVATNTLSANGNFSFSATNAVIPDAPQQFYILQAQ
jgi:alpha-tubulin suppressor-like RCC1 family protein